MYDIIAHCTSGLPEKYRSMLADIQTSMPTISAASENFYKSASQLKSAVIDSTSLTPYKTIKQILAEVDRTVLALQKAQVQVKKNDIEIRRRQSKIHTDPFDAELASVEIVDLLCDSENTEKNIRGAIRKLAFQISMYKSILSALGKDSFTEEDYELEEVRYHIMTAFKQGWIAANARSGHIDEGNLIYLFDLGIPLAAARAEIKSQFDLEQSLLTKNKVLSHTKTLEWLAALAERFMNNPEVFAKARGLILQDSSLLLTE